MKNLLIKIKNFTIYTLYFLFLLGTYYFIFFTQEEPKFIIISLPLSSFTIYLTMRLEKNKMLNKDFTNFHYFLMFQWVIIGIYWRFFSDLEPDEPLKNLDIWAILITIFCSLIPKIKMNPINNKDKEIILGTMIGDSYLLPYEFLRKDLAIKRFNKYKYKQSLFNGYGITSDDSDHTIMTYESILNSNNPKEFQKNLAESLKSWFFTIPTGIGLTTIKSIIKMLLFFPLTKCGVKSLGNGPLMRLSIIAFKFKDIKEKRDAYLKASTELTHNDKEAIYLTQQIGNVWSFIYRHNRIPNLIEMKELIAEKDEFPISSKYISLLLENYHTKLNDFLELIESKKCVTGYIMTSGIFALYLIINFENYKETLKNIILASGDTDTIGALIGGVLPILDKEYLQNKDLNKIMFNEIEKNQYLYILIKNMVATPIILVHGVLRLIKYIIIRN